METTEVMDTREQNVSEWTEEEVDLYLSHLSEESFKNRVPVVAYLTSVSVVGCVGNVIVLLVYWLRFKPSATRVFVLAMALCDLITNIIGLPLQIATIRYAYDTNNDGFCKTMFAVATLTTHISSLILVAVAVDRFHRVWRPHYKQLNHRRAFIVVMAVAAAAVVVFSPFIPLYGIHRVDIGQGQVKARMCWLADDYVDTSYLSAYKIVLAISFFGGLCLMTAAYISIATKVWKQAIVRRFSSRSIRRGPENEQCNPKPQQPTEDLRVPSKKNKLEVLKVHHAIHNSECSEIPSCYLTQKVDSAKFRRPVSWYSESADDVSSREQDSNEVSVNLPFIDLSSTEQANEPEVCKNPGPTSTDSQSAGDADTTKPKDPHSDVNTPQQSGMSAVLMPDQSEPGSACDVIDSNCVITEASCQAKDSGVGTNNVKGTLMLPTITIDVCDSGNQRERETAGDVKALSAASSHVWGGSTGDVKALSATSSHVRGGSTGRGKERVQMRKTPKKKRPKRVVSMHQRQVRSRTTCMMSVLTFFYVINWLPHLIIRFSEKEPVNWCDGVTECGHNLHALSFRSFYLNSAVNAFVYSFCNARFRQEWRILFRVWRRSLRCGQK